MLGCLLITPRAQSRDASRLVEPSVLFFAGAISSQPDLITWCRRAKPQHGANAALSAWKSQPCPDRSSPKQKFQNPWLSTTNLQKMPQVWRSSASLSHRLYKAKLVQSRTAARYEDTLFRGTSPSDRIQRLRKQNSTGLPLPASRMATT